LGPDSVPVDHVEALWDLQYLPIRIKAIPEGSRVNMRVPLWTITNTLDDFFWLTNDLETVTSCETWKIATVATIAYEYNRILKKYAEETGSPLEFVQFQGHDFSMRGMSNRFDAATCGLGHLLSFTGTDTIPAIDAAEDYYNANAETELIGTSVPATEHSVMCMGGKDTEIETFRRLINTVCPSGIVSIVSDTWDFWRVVTEYVTILKNDILARPVNALGLSKVVIRPDSGNPIDIICGNIDVHDMSERSSLEDAKDWMEEILREQVCYETTFAERGVDSKTGYFTFNGATFKVVVKFEWNRYDKQYYYIDGSEVISCDEVTLTPEQKGALECLWEVFGGTVNDKGFRMLDSHIGLIYGDSITIERCEAILAKMKKMGFASSNIVFGIGSYTYQYITRDSLGFAIKATYGEINGVPQEIEKNPITDSGIKKSACGLLRVEKEGDDYVLYDHQTPEQETQGELRTIFEDGKLLVDESFSTIRARLGAL
jgi:nicotinamide phosphoribosyltransferase